MRNYVLSLLAVFLAISFCQAQIPSTSPFNGVVPAVMNTAGGSYDNPNSYHRFEWSFGDMVLIQAFAPADSSVLVTQGVLQPCTDVKSASTLIFEANEFRIFPNPTGGKFELNFFVKTVGQMKLQLVDIMGKIIETRSYRYDGCCRIEVFDISRLPDGLYFIVADLKPDQPRSDGSDLPRHSGLRVVKITPH